MECACISLPGDAQWDDEPIIRRRTAKRNYLCYECNRIIPAGECHEYFYGVLDGGELQAKTCDDCKSVIRQMFCDYIFGSVWEDMRDRFAEFPDNIPWPKLPKLTPAARNMVFQIIEDCWAEDDADD